MKLTKVKHKCIVKFEDTQLSIKADTDGLVSLTDLWRIAKKPAAKRPNDWMLTQEAIDFVKQVSLLTTGFPVVRTKEGKGGGTFAHLQVGLKYAQYLSPEFQKKVNDVFLERIEEELDPELGIQRNIANLDKKLKALGRDDATVLKRLKTVEKRNILTETLANHGVKGSADWRHNGFLQVTNAIYIGWKGKTASAMKNELGLSKKDNLRDHFSDIDLDTCAFIDNLTAHKVNVENTYGAEQASVIGHTVGKSVGNLVANVLGNS